LRLIAYNTCRVIKLEFVILIWFLQGPFDVNSSYELPDDECKTNDFPHISIKTKKDWFYVRMSFGKFTYKLNDKWYQSVCKIFDNSVGIIECYRMAKGTKVPKYDSARCSRVWINFPFSTCHL